MNENNIRIAAASGDPQDKAQETAEKTGLTVGYGVDKATADSLGGYWLAPRETCQPAEFLLGPDNKVRALSYSDGPIGRFDAADVLKHTDYWKRQESS